MASVSEWVDIITKDVPEPLETLVARQVRYALQEFFRLSESWRITLELQNTVDGVHVIGVGTNVVSELPSNTYIAAIKSAYFDDSSGRAPVKLTNTLSERIVLDEHCEHVALVDGQTLCVDGYESGVLKVTVVVQPNRNINEVPDSLADKWFDAIRCGAMNRLLLMSSQPWTDKKSASEFGAIFMHAATQAKREARRDRSAPKRKVQFNKDFRW